MTNYPIVLDGRTFSPDGPAPAPAGGAFRCAMCGRAHPLPTSGVVAGYALHDDDPICYECCAIMDRLTMSDVCAAVDRGERPAPMVLYLTELPADQLAGTLRSYRLPVGLEAREWAPPVVSN